MTPPGPRCFRHDVAPPVANPRRRPRSLRARWETVVTSSISKRRHYVQKGLTAPPVTKVDDSRARARVSTSRDPPGRSLRGKNGTPPPTSTGQTLARHSSISPQFGHLDGESHATDREPALPGSARLAIARSPPPDHRKPGARCPTPPTASWRTPPSEVPSRARPQQMNTDTWYLVAGEAKDLTIGPSTRNRVHSKPRPPNHCPLETPSDPTT